MVTLDCPACTAPIPTELPLPRSVRCSECAVATEITEPDAPGDRAVDRIAA